MVDLLTSPVLMRGNATIAYRDPAALYHDGVFHLFYTLVHNTPDGVAYWHTAVSTSQDLASWTPPRILTPRDVRLNYSSPGNVVRVGDEWLLCLQTYPQPNGEKYGNDDARLYLMRSRDLVTWGDPELLKVKGPSIPVEKMGRMIDPFLLRDRDDPAKWWCFYKQNGLSLSSSYDLTEWTYFGHTSAGENVCVLVDRDEYVMFHSPKNGIGVKRSLDLVRWTDADLITLGQKDWSWARGRLTAGFVLDLRHEPQVGKYLMFFHGSGPEDEQTMFTTHCSLGLAWSEDLVNWHWPV